jgi:exodeoxyribonuclease VII large subunit
MKQLELKAEEKFFSVSEITVQLKNLLESNFGLSSFWVQGEISNFKGKNYSGHLYFSLKDEKAILPCVFFKNSNEKSLIELKEGLQVLILGRINLYEPHDRYQFIIEAVKLAGLGDLYQQFEMLKKKLAQLFLEEFKKPLPEFPKKIGLITSPTGAVVEDIINGITKRYPLVEIIINPVHVQGEKAKKEIAQAIAEFNKKEYQLDLMILARGGGSIEDLWAFNEELVARAIFASKVPVVSAVGHMTDYTIADFVSDVRAATPSNAAEMVVPAKAEIISRLDFLMTNIKKHTENYLKVCLEKVRVAKDSFIFRRPDSLLVAPTQVLADLAADLVSSINKKVEQASWRLKEIKGSLVSLDPQRVLERGYSIVEKQGQLIKDILQVEVQDDVLVTLAKGQLDCKINKKRN